ncbi:hypothetical protein V1277_000799 [Bradyrhizobium sp. AZCC 1588]|uniref:hypothetical protein n=1 Tax=unclassified Bradyrhizobium TaxID=2631580 RepID=UPI002FEF8B55
MQASGKLKWVVAIAGIIGYFALASYFKYSYPLSGKEIAVLRGFERLGDSPHAVVAHSWIPTGARLGEPDSEDDNERSRVLIYEDDKPLGPPHSVHADIAKLGMGRFSHWRGQGFVFSSSDNSDPATNGRSYRAVVPETTD